MKRLDRLHLVQFEDALYQLSPSHLLIYVFIYTNMRHVHMNRYVCLQLSLSLSLSLSCHIYIYVYLYTYRYLLTVVFYSINRAVLFWRS